jgi:hypothetical protein
MGLERQLGLHLVQRQAGKLQLVLQIGAFAKFDGVPEVEHPHEPVQLLPAITARELRAQSLLRLRPLMERRRFPPSHEWVRCVVSG